MQGGRTLQDFFTLVYSDNYCRVLAKRGSRSFSYGEAQLEPGIVVGGKIVRPETFIVHLTEILKHAHGGAIKARRAVVALPEEKVFIQIVQIPKVPEEKVADVIRWQSEKLISFSLDSVSMDYTIIEDKGSTMKVCVTASPKDVIESVVETLNKIGCKVVSLDTHSNTLAHLFAVKPHVIYMLVSVEPNKVTLVIAKNSVARLATVMPFNGDAHLLENKLQETIQYYHDRKEADKKIGEIVLFGDIGSLIIGGADQRLGVPMRWVKIQEFWGKATKDQLNSYIINTGLCLKQKKGINLLPENLKQLVNKENFLISIYEYVHALIYVCVLLGILSAALLFWQKQHVDSLNSQLTAQLSVPENVNLTTLEKNVTGLNTKLQTMKKLTSTPLNDNGYINNIFTLFPKTGTFTSLEFSRAKGTIIIKGVSPDRDTLLSFRTTLKEIKGVKSVSFPLANFDVAKNVPFELTINTP